jgi:hypothetical protein
LIFIVGNQWLHSAGPLLQIQMFLASGYVFHPSFRALHIMIIASSFSMKIRVNLYVTTLLNAFIPNHPIFHPLRDVLIANAGVSGTALLITAVIQTAQHQLSLYHAIFILHMLFFLGITVSPTGTSISFTS